MKRNLVEAASPCASISGTAKSQKKTKRLSHLLFDIGLGICHVCNMGDYRHVKLFRNGRNQAVRIPREFELPAGEAVMRRDGDRLVIEPLPRPRLAEVLRGLKPVTDRLPSIVDKPPEPVVL